MLKAGVRPRVTDGAGVRARTGDSPAQGEGPDCVAPKPTLSLSPGAMVEVCVELNRSRRGTGTAGTLEAEGRGILRSFLSEIHYF